MLADMDTKKQPLSVLSTETSDESDGFIGQIETFLQEAIESLEPELVEGSSDKAGRPRVLPSLCLWSGLLVCVLRGFNSQLALWRLLTVQQLWSYPRFDLSDQAIYKRLGSGGTAVLEQLFEQISALLAERLEPYKETKLAPFASEIMALDGMTLDKIARLLPALRQLLPGDSQLLPGKLAGLFDIRRQQWRRVQHIANPNENDKVIAREMVSQLPKGSLILADLGYFGFAWFDYLTDMQYWWLSRLRTKTSFVPIHTYFTHGNTFDGLVWLGKYRSDQAAYAVRLVQFQVGSKCYQYITNVHDPNLLPMTDIAKLYARRWDIELAFKLIKRHLNLHLLWSCKTSVILQQVWAVLIISQILQALRMEIAGRAEVEPFDVSMQLLIEYLPILAANGQDPIALFIEYGRKARFIRPSSRLQTKAPTIPPDQFTPLPLDLVLSRKPRYAGKL